MINKYFSYPEIKLYKYFDLPVFISLSLILPSTLTIVAIIICIFLQPQQSLVIKYLNKPVSFINIIYLGSLLAVIICFIDIVEAHIGKRKSISKSFTEYKSYINLAIIFLGLFYTLFIFLLFELEKLGNIPVGQN